MKPNQQPNRGTHQRPPSSAEDLDRPSAPPSSAGTGDSSSTVVEWEIREANPQNDDIRTLPDGVTVRTNFLGREPTAVELLTAIFQTVREWPAKIQATEKHRAAIQAGIGESAEYKRLAEEAAEVEREERWLSLAGIYHALVGNELPEGWKHRTEWIEAAYFHKWGVIDPDHVRSLDKDDLCRVKGLDGKSDEVNWITGKKTGRMRACTAKVTIERQIAERPPAAKYVRQAPPETNPYAAALAAIDWKLRSYRRGLDKANEALKQLYLGVYPRPDVQALFNQALAAGDAPPQPSSGGFPWWIALLFIL